MVARLPIKSLVRLNWLLSLVSSAIVFLFLIQNEPERDAFLYTAMTAVIMGIIGYANIGILVYLFRRYTFRSKVFKITRYAATYLVSEAAYFGIWPLFSQFSAGGHSYRERGV
ncbi:MAG TPA: hypothetical protein VKQ52_20650, partial [Puia sp.]|nr:hypothetical protein [Puia sp.]